MQVTVTTPVHPTEVPERVVAAATRFWPDGAVEQADDRVTVRVAGTDALDLLRHRVWELRIIDAFRGGLRADDRVLRFRLSKQAALAGKAAAPPTPHVLGDLAVAVALEDGDPWPDAEHLRWWLCPETAEGEIVGPTEPPGAVPDQS